MAVLLVLSVPILVNAQACLPGLVDCPPRGCVTPSPATACTATDRSGRIGTLDECGVCANLACPGGQTLCGTPGACRDNATACPGGSNRAYNACDGCGGCSTGFTDCDGGAGFNCQATTSPTCPAPRTYNACTGACTDPYVVINSTTPPQTGFFNITGNGTLGGDLFLTSGRAIRVDSATASTRLNVGNFLAGPEFHLALHAEGTGLAELLFRQGANDRWALSVRPGASTTAAGADFEIRRGVADWPRVLAIDYATGEVTIDENVVVARNLTVGTGFTFPSGAPVGSMITAGDVYTNALFSRLAAASADNIWLGDANDIIQVRGNAVVGGNLSATGDAAGARLCIGGLGGDCRAAWPAAGSTATGTGGRLALFTGMGASSTLGDSIISQTPGTISVGGAITATGCFGPQFRRVTALSFDGLQGGYAAVNAFCAAVEPGSRVCTNEDMLTSINCGVTLPIAGTAWLLNGAPSSTSPAANDCAGWTSNTATTYGSYWSFTSRQGVATSCSTSHAFACCR